MRNDTSTQDLNSGIALKLLEEVNWVSDYLQEDLKPKIRDSVRIYLYGYDSGWMIDALVVDVHNLRRHNLIYVQIPGRIHSLTPTTYLNHYRKL